MKFPIRFLLVVLAMGFPLLSEAADNVARMKVVTTFTILRDIAQNVAGTAADVESITKPGAEIHEYDPTPLDIVRAQSGHLVLWNGMGLERWFERFFSKINTIPSSVVTAGIDPIGISEGPYNGKPNPHCWMSPKNALKIVDNVRRSLSDLDPKNADLYSRNATEYSKRIGEIDNKLALMLSEVPAGQRWLVSSEGAFSYLVRDYAMRELYLWPVNSDEEGTPQQVRRVIDTVRTNRIPVVFSESTISDKPMQQVVKETGAHYGGVLYVDSLTGPEGPAPTYLKLLEFNAESIVAGFRGR
jgi:manganese/iron transport system substrate-binding protein